MIRLVGGKTLTRPRYNIITYYYCYQILVCRRRLANNNIILINPIVVIDTTTFTKSHKTVCIQLGAHNEIIFYKMATMPVFRAFA